MLYGPEDLRRAARFDAAGSGSALQVLRDIAWHLVQLRAFYPQVAVAAGAEHGVSQWTECPFRFRGSLNGSRHEVRGNRWRTENDLVRIRSMVANEQFERFVQHGRVNRR